MKKWIHASTDNLEVIESSDRPKLKRTPESGHSYEGDTTFNNVEEMKKWLEEDELYED